MTIASILSDLWRVGGGGAFEAPPPPPQAQELQKSPGGTGLSDVDIFGTPCLNTTYTIWYRCACPGTSARAPSVNIALLWVICGPLSVTIKIIQLDS